MTITRNCKTIQNVLDVMEEVRLYNCQVKSS